MITMCNEAILPLLLDDPLRPALFSDNLDRLKPPFAVYADVEPDGEVLSIICAVLTNTIPDSEQELQLLAALDGWDEEKPSILCPYSMWSYQKNSVRTLLNQLIELTSIVSPEVKRVVTMSPMSVDIGRFHRNNGAKIIVPPPRARLEEGEIEFMDNIHYEYKLPNVVFH